MRQRPHIFRLLLAGLAAGIAGPAIAQSCVPGNERTAFEVRALQSQLQVAALTCRDQGFPQLEAQYREFVQKFQTEFRAPARTLQGHFRRTRGNAHQRELDAYITNLANAQMQDGLRQGSHFCPLVAPLFGAALAQSSADGLATISVERNLLNIVDTSTVCPERATPARATRTRPGRARPPARRAANTRSAAVRR